MAAKMVFVVVLLISIHLCAQIRQDRDALGEKVSKEFFFL